MQSDGVTKPGVEIQSEGSQVGWARPTIQFGRLYSFHVHPFLTQLYLCRHSLFPRLLYDPVWGHQQHCEMPFEMPNQCGLTRKTGLEAPSRILLATLPYTHRLRPDRPWVAMAMRAEGVLLA